MDEGDRAIRYGELARFKDQLAAVLQDLGVRRGDRVGLLIGNSIAACQSVLGVLRADACYVALDPSFPPQRLATIIVDAGIRVVLSVGACAERLAQVVAALDVRRCTAAVFLDVPDGQLESIPVFEKLRSGTDTIRGATAINAASGSRRPNRATDDELAYVMYTSGTTGKPKGVMISHANVKSFVRWAVEYFALSPSDRMSNHSSMSFDLSVFDVFGPLFAGGTICPVTTLGDRTFPGPFMAQRRITVWFSVPSVIAMLRRSGQLNQPGFAPHLRAAIFCGEALLREHAEAWIAARPDVPIYNIYGPTEATIACTHHHVNRDSPLDSSSLVAIGRPCRDVEILVLKQETDELAETAEIGRLMICGRQLAAGYWGRPDLTEQAFRPHPFKTEPGTRMYDTGDLAYRDVDGFLYCVGRRDSQVKVMGYRIELSEIDSILAGHPAVNEVATVCLHDQDTELVAAVSLTASGRPPQIDETLLDHCAEFLPSYMVPKRIVMLEALPKNVNGKIDRAAIAKLVQPERFGETA